MTESGTAPSVDTMVLDVDGTLIDSTYHHALAWARALRRLGHDVPLWRIHAAIGMGGDRLVEYLMGDEFEECHGAEARESWRTEYGRLVYSVPALPGGRDLIRHLDELGVGVVLATSGDPEFTRHALTVLQAEQHVDDVVVNDEVSSSKPAPDLLQAALDSVAGRRAVVLGDTVWDARAAVHAGLPMVGLRTGGVSAEALLEAGAATVYDEPVGLLAALDDVLALG